MAWRNLVLANSQLLNPVKMQEVDSKKDPMSLSHRHACKWKEGICDIEVIRNFMTKEEAVWLILKCKEDSSYTINSPDSIATRTDGRQTRRTCKWGN